MKNCRRSDRQLAKVLGVSQPTVSRLLGKLEKAGFIKEYVALPDFGKLGYKLLAITFARTKRGHRSEVVEKARKVAVESLKEGPLEVVMLERGLGLDYDGSVISYHADYTSYRRLLEWIRQFDFVDLEQIDSFLIDLDDKIHYRTLTFSALADHVMTLGKKEEKP